MLPRRRCTTSGTTPAASPPSPIATDAPLSPPSDSKKIHSMNSAPASGQTPPSRNSRTERSRVLR
ncbi:hypothetical protein ACFQ60_26220 [Streptomyces zhihengii]